MIAIPLPTVVVYGDGACLSRERAASDAHLSSLWDEVREGVELRRAFDLRYRYKRELAQSSETLVPNRQTMRRQRADTVASEPDSVVVREACPRAARAEGFGKGNSLTLPDERGCSTTRSSGRIASSPPFSTPLARRAYGFDRPPRFGEAVSAFAERSGWTARPASCDVWNSST